MIRRLTQKMHQLSINAMEGDAPLGSPASLPGTAVNVLTRNLTPHPLRALSIAGQRKRVTTVTLQNIPQEPHTEGDSEGGVENPSAGGGVEPPTTRW